MRENGLWANYLESLTTFVHCGAHRPSEGFVSLTSNCRVFGPGRALARISNQ